MLDLFGVKYTVRGTMLHPTATFEMDGVYTSGEDALEDVLEGFFKYFGDPLDEENVNIITEVLNLADAMLKDTSSDVFKVVNINGVDVVFELSQKFLTGMMSVPVFLQEFISKLGEISEKKNHEYDYIHRILRLTDVNDFNIHKEDYDMIMNIVTLDGSIIPLNLKTMEFTPPKVGVSLGKTATELYSKEGELRLEFLADVFEKGDFSIIFKLNEQYAIAG